MKKIISSTLRFLDEIGFIQIHIHKNFLTYIVIFEKINIYFQMFSQIQIQTQYNEYMLY